MPDNSKDCRRGADPPKNESGLGLTDGVSTRGQSCSICYHQERHLHRGQDLFQLPTREDPEEDFTQAIILPASYDDVTRA
jgi:hypothetical protein